MVHDWCPLFGSVPAAWPAEARDIIAEARRIAGVKARTSPRTFDAERLEKVCTMAAAAPAWLEYRAAAQRQAVGFDTLAFDVRAALPPRPADQDARLTMAVLAIVAARIACETRSEASLVDACLILQEAQAGGQQAALEGARKGKTKATPAERLTLEHEAIVTAARTLLAEGAPRYGLAGRVRRRIKADLSERQINNVLTAAGI